MYLKLYLFQVTSEKFWSNFNFRLIIVSAMYNREVIFMQAVLTFYMEAWHLCLHHKIVTSWKSIGTQYFILNVCTVRPELFFYDNQICIYCS